MKKIYFILSLIILILLATCVWKFYSYNYRLANTIEEKSKHCIPYHPSFRAQSFLYYFAFHDIKQEAENLKQGMDETSIDYIDKFIGNSRYWGKCVNKLFNFKEENTLTAYDKQLKEYYFDFYKNYKQPFPEILEIDSSMIAMKYGLRDIPREIFQKINGKDIIDAGAMNGDTAYIFHNLFPKSHIYSYEPVGVYFEDIKKMLSKMNKNDAKYIHPIKKGLADSEFTSLVDFGEAEPNAKFVTLDKDYELYPHKQLGLIKMDIEGFESDALKGMEKNIKKYKPVLIISIYHNPEDFFGMKDKIKKLNPNYKFKIRKNADTELEEDIVLVAY